MDVLDKLWEMLKQGAMLALACITLMAIVAGVMMVGHSVMLFLW